MPILDTRPGAVVGPAHELHSHAQARVRQGMAVECLGNQITRRLLIFAQIQFVKYHAPTSTKAPETGALQSGPGASLRRRMIFPLG